MRNAVRTAWIELATQFSDDAPRLREDVLQKRYSAFAAWPADAQLGLVLLGWVLGPGFSIAGFAQAANQLLPQFNQCAKAVTIGTSPTAVAIEENVKTCFRNAAVVVRYDLDASILYWPLELKDPWTSSNT